MNANALIVSAFHALTAHIAVLDRDGNILEVNAAWRNFALANDCPDLSAYVGTNYVTACADAAATGDVLASEALAGISAVLTGAREGFVQRYPCHAPNFDRWFQMTVTPMPETGGVTIAHVDVTPLVSAERNQALLVDELNHRVKNMLAVVQSIAFQTARSTPEPEAFQSAFSSRILALARVHDLLTLTAWRSADLEDVVSTCLAPHSDGIVERITISGPPGRLRADTAVAFNLCLHELATNAAKYGALANTTGSLSVTWQFDPAHDRVSFVWEERGGPPVEPPVRKGFGMRLIESMGGKLAAQPVFLFEPEGVRCELALPIDSESGAKFGTGEKGSGPPRS